MAASLKLAKHLLAEGLLDREHYFDWLLTALNYSDLDTLSMYMLIARTHLDEIGQHRRYGHRLANSLLMQLHKVRTYMFMTIVDLTMAADRISAFPRRLQRFENQDFAAR